MTLTPPAESPLPDGFPAWVTPSLPKAGRDPLALQTITEDRITPILLPGVLALSQRARYFSYYPFLLDEYRRAELRASNAGLDVFIKRRDFEFAVAARLCPNCPTERTGASGADQARAALKDAGDAAIERRDSVESDLGGYGLYYKSPLVDLGVVAPKGTLMKQSETATPIDLLYPDGAGPGLAEAFREAVKDTVYFKDYFTTSEPIPQEVLVDYARVGCLCRLGAHPDEQALLRKLLFESGEASAAAEVDQRRRTFALLLSTIAEDAVTFSDDVAFRRVVLEQFSRRESLSGPHARTAGQWAALVMKEHLQEALSIIWIDFLRRGGVESGAGFTPGALRAFITEQLTHPWNLPLADGISLPAEMPTREAVEVVRSAADGIDNEALLSWALQDEKAMRGLALLLAVVDRVPSEPPTAFAEIALSQSERQPGLLRFRALLEQHLAEEPTVADTMRWLVGRFVINAHELVAYSKLPDFTFRFRWEGGRLVFYQVGVIRFQPSGNRREAVATISEDLGFCTSEDGRAVLTSDGQAFVAEVFG